MTEKTIRIKGENVVLRIKMWIKVLKGGLRLSKGEN